MFWIENFILMSRATSMHDVTGQYNYMYRETHIFSLGAIHFILYKMLLDK